MTAMSAITRDHGDLSWTAMSAITRDHGDPN
jgi:hypothetical protein